MKIGTTTTAQRFQDGLSQADQGEYRRAVAIFAECVSAEPDNLEFVETLLAHLYRGPNALHPMQVTAEEAEARSNALVCEGWATVLQLGPRQLAEQSGDMQTLLALATAAQAAGYRPVEARYLQAAIALAPGDVAVQRRAAQAFSELQRTDEALACWRRVESLEPGDAEATRMISAFIIAKSRERAGMHDERRPSASVSRVRELAPSAERSRGETDRIWQRKAWEQVSSESPDFKRTPLQELEAAIRDLPANPAPYVQLAAMYLERGREYDAERLLAKGREATAGDLNVLQMWEEVVISRLEKKVAGARELAEADESPQARAALDAARNERDRLETEILVGRCLREPENAEFRYQLGLRLKRAGKLREACVALQAALAGSSQKALAALAIGECHEELDEVPEALKHFRLAADSAFIPDQVECKQRALYEASRLVVGLNLPRLAQRYLGELLRLAPEHAEGAQLLAQVAAGESSSPPSPPHTIG